MERTEDMRKLSAWDLMRTSAGDCSPESRMHTTDCQPCIAARFARERNLSVAPCQDRRNEVDWGWMRKDAGRYTRSACKNTTGRQLGIAASHGQKACLLTRREGALSERPPVSTRGMLP